MPVLKQFPKDMSALPVDRKHLRRCLVSGWFEETVECGGRQRRFCTYLAPGLEYSRPSLIIAPPDGPDTEAWIDAGCWESFAADAQVFLHFLLPDGTYGPAGADAEYLEKVRQETHSRTHYVEIPDNLYLLGFGRGAAVVQQVTSEYTEDYSGITLFPADDVCLDRQACAGGRRPQLPVWIFAGEENPARQTLAAFWKHWNGAEELCFSESWKKDPGRTGIRAEEIWVPSAAERKSRTNEEPLGEVRVSGFSGAAVSGEAMSDSFAVPSREVLDELWSFLGRAARHRNPGAKALRTVQDPEKYGLERREMEVDGYSRIWYEYVPSAVRESGAKAEARGCGGTVPENVAAVPLVVCMHPRGGSAETFISLTNMNQVAEERGFIVVFPEAGVYQQKPGGLNNVALWEGMLDGRRFDDVKFIRAVVEDVCGREPVDRARIYACGQSSGGMMTCSLAVHTPELFTAAAPWSGTGNIGLGVAAPEQISPKIPFFFMMGERDVLCSDPEHGIFEFRASAGAAAFLGGVMKAYGLEGRRPGIYCSGEIRFFVYSDERGIPWLTVGVVRNMPHGNYPRQSWLTYDEFLCKWTRKDGILYYMGMPV